MSIAKNGTMHVKKTNKLTIRKIYGILTILPANIVIIYVFVSKFIFYKLVKKQIGSIWISWLY